MNPSRHLVGKYYALVLANFGEEYIPGPDGTYEIRYKCPECESSGSRFDDFKLFANTQSRKFNCFRCGWSGALDLGEDSIQEGSSDAFLRSIEEYARTINPQEDDHEDRRDPVFYKIPQYSPGRTHPATRYLESRGISYDQIIKYGVRVPVDADPWIYQGRLLLPNIVRGGTWTDMYIARTFTDQSTKILNPPNSPRRQIVYNLHRIPQDPEYLIVFEGALEVVYLDDYAVATYGKFLTDEQVELIRIKNPKVIYLTYDYDASPDKGIHYDVTQYKVDNAIRKLKSALPMTEVRWVIMPPGKDVMDMTKDEFRTKYLSESIPYVNEVQYKLMVKSVSKVPKEV